MTDKEPMRLPANGTDWDALAAQMQAARAGDADWRDGRLGVFVHYAGEDVLEVAKRAYAMFFTENGLGPSAFPSLARFEKEVIEMTLGLLNAPAGARGTMTSGGTESILLAMKAARDRAREQRRGGSVPKVVAAVSVHPAFDKAAHLLGMDVVRVPLQGLAPDLAAIGRAIDTDTIALVASAPNYPYGTIDPVAEFGALAERHGLWLHVDACVGGYSAPFATKLGHALPEFDFAIPAVTSMSADCHKYGFAAKGASAVMFRDPDAWRHLAYRFENWPRGVYHTQTFVGTRPGGAIAAAWAVMRFLGEAGYLNVTQRILAVREAIERGVTGLGCRVVGRPQLGITAYTHESLDIFAIGDALGRRGWFVSRLAEPRGLHLMLNLLHEPVVERYLLDLEAAIAEVQTAARPASAARATY